DFIFDKDQLSSFNNICICGLMGMASFTENNELIKNEFIQLKKLFDKYSRFENAHLKFHFLSMGMSSDYKIAIAEGSNMVRIGSLLFGAREKQM
ncbi:MAG: alanine racemase, partial [Bacteroidota bacterium]